MSKILVAEDERGTRLIVKQLLEKQGHEVVEASNGTTAYELAMSEAPDIGVLDVRMPGMDGFEVLRRLKQHPDTEHMPIIMLTSVPIEKGEATAASFGASHYLPKPLDPGTLKLVVRSALREAAMLRLSPNPPKDTDGRREESGRGGEGATGEIAWVPFGVGRSADGLHRRTGAPMAVCGSCDARDGERIRSRELSRTGLARVCGDLRLSGGWVADGAVRPGVEWLAAGPRRG